MLLYNLYPSKELSYSVQIPNVKRSYLHFPKNVLSLSLKKKKSQQFIYSSYKGKFPEQALETQSNPELPGPWECEVPQNQHTITTQALKLKLLSGPDATCRYKASVTPVGRRLLKNLTRDFRPSNPRLEKQCLPQHTGVSLETAGSWHAGGTLATVHTCNLIFASASLGTSKIFLGVGCKRMLPLLFSSPPL